MSNVPLLAEASIEDVPKHTGIRVLYHSVHTIDCTADPHPVNYPTLTEALRDIVKVCASNLIQSVLSVTLDCNGKDDYYQADRYTNWDSFQYATPEWKAQNANKKKKPASGHLAEKHKVNGLFFAEDAHEYVDTGKVDDKGEKVMEKVNLHGERHLPPGLTGVRRAVDIILRDPTKFEVTPAKNPQDHDFEPQLVIGVIWTAFGEHNCSDYITLPLGQPEVIVDYSNQDDYTGTRKYYKHIADLRALLGAVGNQVYIGEAKCQEDIEPTDGFEEAMNPMTTAMPPSEEHASNEATRLA